jgi:hypothetical protein
VLDHFSDRTFGDSDESSVVTRVIPRESFTHIRTGRIDCLIELLFQLRVTERGSGGYFLNPLAQFVAELPRIKVSVVAHAALITQIQCQLSPSNLVLKNDVRKRSMKKTQVALLQEIAESANRLTGNPGTPEPRNLGTSEPRNLRTPELRNPGTDRVLICPVISSPARRPSESAPERPGRGERLAPRRARATFARDLRRALRRSRTPSGSTALARDPCVR